MESRTTPVVNLNDIKCFGDLKPRTTSGKFNGITRHNACFNDAETLHIVNNYITKFMKMPTKTTELQEMILDLSGYVKPF